MAAMVDQPITEAIKFSLASLFCLRTSALFIVSPMYVAVSLCGNTVASAT